MVTNLPLFRLFNKNTGDHFYTTSESERQNAIKNLHYDNEGIACYISPVESSGLIPLYRMYNGTDHFYTTSTNEYNVAWNQGGYNQDSLDLIAGYVTANPDSSLSPLYRVYNGIDHFYTCSEAERDDSINNLGYQDEGTACYVIGAPLNLNYVFDNLIYKQHILPPSSHDLIGTHTIRNDSKQTELTQEVTISNSISSTFEWGLTQQLGVSVTMGVEAGIPDIASVKQDVTLSLDLGAHQTWITTQEMTYTASTSVTVPPQEAVEVDGFVDFTENVAVPFELYVRLNGTTANIQLNQAQLISLLLMETPNFPLADIDTNTLPTEVILKFDGEFTGSYGINTLTQVKPLGSLLTM
jgi:Repeat of unknown function (DUF5648)/Clostridium epsilon toxin ETX/Bacillus mosquitocidal toxin MTX2